MEGAKLFFCWSYSPPTKVQAGFTFRNTVHENRGVALYTLANSEPQLRELAEAAMEIRYYERIITRMAKLPASPIETKGKGTFNRAFSFPGLKGKVVVINNSNVGTWPGNSRDYFREDDPIYIDDEGNLLDYVPFEQPQEIHFSRVDSADNSPGRVFDIKSCAEISCDNDGYKVAVMPGSGRLLFIGSEREAKQLHQLMK